MKFILCRRCFYVSEEIFVWLQHATLFVSSLFLVTDFIGFRYILEIPLMIFTIHPSVKAI